MFLAASKLKIWFCAELNVELQREPAFPSTFRLLSPPKSIYAAFATKNNTLSQLPPQTDVDYYSGRLPVRLHVDVEEVCLFALEP